MSTTPAGMASPTDIHAEIIERITDDGLSSDCTDEEKLFYVWRLLQHNEVDLQQSVENEERLRKTQAEEMHEVESYVEHIRHLSDERELLIQELEGENDQLKLDNREMKQTISAMHMTASHTSEEMIKHGLEEMASASVSEQVAFLLVERSHMMQETQVDGVKVMEPEAKPFASGDHGDQKQTMDELMKEEREIMRQKEERLKTSHEEEINLLMDESDKLEEQLADVKAQKDDMQKENERLKTELDKEVKNREAREKETPSPAPAVPRPASPARTNSDMTLRKIIADKTQIECELVAIKSRLKQTDAENERLTNSVKHLEQDLDVTKTQKLSLESKYTKAKTQLYDVEQQTEILEATCEELKCENFELNEKLSADKKDTHMAVKQQQETMKTLENMVESLQGEKSELMEMLHSQRDEKHTELMQAQEKYEAGLRMKEEQLAREMRETEDQLSSEVKKNQQLTAEISAKEDRLNYEVMKNEDTLDSEMKKNKQLSCEMKKKEEQIAELEDTVDLLNGAKTDSDTTKMKLDAVFKDSQKLMGRLKESQNVLAQTEERERHLLDQQATLQSSMESVEQRHAKDIEGLKAKLQLSLQEFGKLRTVLEQEKVKSSDLEVKLKDAKDQHIAEKEDLEMECENNTAKVNSLEAPIQEMQDDMFLSQKEVKSLEARIQEMQDDMFLGQEELENSQERYEKMAAHFNSERNSIESEFVDKVAKLTKERDQLEMELHKNVDSQLSGETLIKQKQDEIKSKDSKIKTLSDETTSLKTELKSIKSKLKTEVDKNKTLSQENGNLHKNSTETQSNLEQSHKAKINTLNKKVLVLEKSCEEKHKLIETKDKDYETLEKSLMKNVSNLEEQCAKLAKDKTDLSKQVSSLTVKCKDQDQKLQKAVKERRGRLNSAHDELQKSQQEVNSTQDRVKHLREELQTKQQNITALEMDALTAEARHEGQSHKLQLENNELRLQHTREIGVLNENILEGTRETKRLQQLAEERQAKIELQQKELEAMGERVKRLENEVKRMENEVNLEKKLRGELQGRNGSLDAEIHKVWTQVAVLNDKITNLENSKKCLEVELERIVVPISQSEKLLQNASNTEFEMKEWRSRCEVAEGKVERLQLELGETVVKMQTAERRYYGNTATTDNQTLKEATLQNFFLDENKDHMEPCKQYHRLTLSDRCHSRITAYSVSADGPGPTKDLMTYPLTMLEQTVTELQQQVKILKSRESQLCDQSRELQHRMIDMDGQMSLMRDRAQLATEISQKAESNRRKMSEKIVRLQRDLKCVHEELTSSNEKRDMWERRYDERRLRMRSKLSKAREYYTEERKKLRDQVSQLGEDLRVTRTSLTLEQQWKDKMDNMYHSLMEEKRLLLAQISEQGETSRDQHRQLAMLDARTKFLEKENSLLQERVNGQVRNKRPTINKSYSFHSKPSWARSRDSVAMTTSGLGNSMDTSWDQDHLSDATITPSNTIPQNGSRFNREGEYSESERSFEV